jgi:phage terminase large subunit
MFVRTTAINKLLELEGRVRVIPGGTSAGKTFGIIPILINQAASTKGLEISIVSESIPHLRRGAMKDFLKIMKWTGRFFDDRWNRTLLTYTFANGSYIEFFSADQDSKMRGARRTHLYVNEANNISFEAYHQMAIRTSEQIWIDFNPTMPFWAHEELKEAEWLTLTYKDNEALSSEIVSAIEEARVKAETSDYWRNWWQVYGLGQVGSLQGVVFDNWQIIG